MNIKKSIVGSLFSMLLVSEMAAADWGDVYYCQMTSNIEISLEGEKESYPLERFQFKLDQTKNAMVFGSKGYFINGVIELVDGWGSFISQEIWRANNGYSMTGFDNGEFLYTYNSGLSATVISADCEKF